MDGTGVTTERKSDRIITCYICYMSMKSYLSLTVIKITIYKEMLHKEMLHVYEKLPVPDCNKNHTAK